MTNHHSIFQQLSITHICVLAVGLRIAWALLVPVIPMSDSAAYDTFALNIWQHGTYGWTPERPTAFWPVGTSAIYSLLYMLFGHNYLPIIIVNIGCTLAIIVLTRALCDRFFSHPSIGLVSALLIALWPTLIFYTTVLASELPYMAVLMGAFYLLTTPSPNIIKLGLSSGILFAIAYYIRPLAIVTLFIAAFYLCIQGTSIRIWLPRSLLSLIMLALLVSPWAHRNYELYNAFVPMSTNGGVTLWMGNHPGTDGSYAPVPERFADVDEYTRNQTLKQEAIDHIKAEPVTFITRTIKKFFQFHLRETIGVGWNEKGIQQALGDWALMPLKLVAQSYWSIILLAALAGIIIMIIQQGFWHTAFHPFILLWASSAGIHAIIVSQDRYHIPIIPMVTAFAVYAGHYINSKWAKGVANDSTSE
ncbi:glycosyltransferase family 39 protein [Eionea flava]